MAETIGSEWPGRTIHVGHFQQQGSTGIAKPQGFPFVRELALIGAQHILDSKDGFHRNWSFCHNE